MQPFPGRFEHGWSDEGRLRERGRGGRQGGNALLFGPRQAGAGEIGGMGGRLRLHAEQPGGEGLDGAPGLAAGGVQVFTS